MFKQRGAAKVRALWRLAWLLPAAWVTGGCDNATRTSETGPERFAVKEVSVDKLPPLEDYMPPLDSGKLLIARPKGWKQLTRGDNNKYLTRFVLTDPTGLPRILVSVEESLLEGFDSATAENVVELAEAIAAGLKQRKADVIESAKPMLIGKNPFVRYVLKSRFRDAGIERQMLQTLVDGRLYTIDLQVDAGDIKMHRDAAYAVAAGLQFPAPTSAGQPESAPASAGTEK